LPLTGPIRDLFIVRANCVKDFTFKIVEPIRPIWNEYL